MSPASNAHKPPFRDRIIPWYFVMAFAVVLAVNVVFVREALKSNTGVVTEQAYEKGLAYNRVLAAANAQKSLGWENQITYTNGALHVTLHDHANAPIAGAQVTAYIERPLEAGLAKTLTLDETDKAVYAAPVEFPKKGQWDVTVSVVWDKQYYQVSKRLVVQ